MSDIEHRLTRVIYRVRWSPADAAFVASTYDYPELSATGDYPLQAINALKAHLRRALQTENGAA